MTSAIYHDDPGGNSATVADKVRKLLAMAEGSSNPNEADAFSSKAAQMIARHRIDPQQLQTQSRRDLTIGEFELGRGAYVRGRLQLLTVVAESAGCETVFQVRDVGTVALVAGFPDDLDACGLLYQSLHTQATARMAMERRSTGAATQRWRRSFLFGFADQVGAMLATADQQARNSLHPSSATVPALRAKQQKVAEFARREFGRVTAARRPRAAQPDGYSVGKLAARRADVGRKRISGLRSLGPGPKT